jgi:hypothetical protein
VKTKRVLADVPEDFFWEMKKRLADMKLTQKDTLAVAIRQFIGSSFPLDKLITDPEVLQKLNALGIK